VRAVQDAREADQVLAAGHRLRKLVGAVHDAILEVLVRRAVGRAERVHVRAAAVARSRSYRHATQAGALDFLWLRAERRVLRVVLLNAQLDRLGRVEVFKGWGQG